MKNDEQNAAPLTALEKLSRRSFLTRAGMVGVAGATVTMAAPIAAAAEETKPLTQEAAATPIPGTMPITLKVNGKVERIQIDPRATVLDTLRETITTAIQVNLSMVTIEESETTKRLAGWAGMFAVATMFAGIWGMNFKHMPELDWTYGYPVALGVIVLTCGLLYTRFRKAGWL